MRRSEAVLGILLNLVLLAAPVPSPGQPPAKVYRVGWLTGGRAETDPRVCLRTVNPFRQAWNEVMRARGYVEGQNLTLECRRTETERTRPGLCG